jgi:hypothetical protein
MTGWGTVDVHALIEWALDHEDRTIRLLAEWIGREDARQAENMSTTLYLRTVEHLHYLRYGTLDPRRHPGPIPPSQRQGHPEPP